MLAEHAPTLLTAGVGSGAVVATEALPEGFFQAISQLFIAAVTVWKILHDAKKSKQDSSNK